MKGLKCIIWFVKCNLILFALKLTISYLSHLPKELGGTQRCEFSPQREILLCLWYLLCQRISLISQNVSHYFHYVVGIFIIKVCCSEGICFLISALDNGSFYRKRRTGRSFAIPTSKTWWRKHLISIWKTNRCRNSGLRCSLNLSGTQWSRYATRIPTWSFACSGSLIKNRKHGIFCVSVLYGIFHKGLNWTIKLLWSTFFV